MQGHAIRVWSRKYFSSTFSFTFQSAFLDAVACIAGQLIRV